MSGLQFAAIIMAQNSHVKLKGLECKLVAI